MRLREIVSAFWSYDSDCRTVFGNEPSGCFAAFASFTILFFDRVRSEAGMCEPSGIASTAPSFLDEGLGLSLSSGQAMAKTIRRTAVFVDCR
jgi:hypothetical protein